MQKSLTNQQRAHNKQLARKIRAGIQRAQSTVCNQRVLNQIVAEVEAKLAAEASAA